MRVMKNAFSLYKNNYKLNFGNKINSNLTTKIYSFQLNSFSTKTQPTIFDKIINKEIKSEIVYEDKDVIAFKDVNPVAPIHIILIPKEKDNLTGISKAEDKNVEILGTLLLSVKKLGDKLNVKEGYRIVINEGMHGGQTVEHLHLHFLAGKQFGWPPGTDIDYLKK